MIAYLEGQLWNVEAPWIVIQTQGVGYEVECTERDCQKLAKVSSKKQALWIYTHVREDKLKLYGFLKKQEKDFFICLLNVRGIGPKVAMSIITNNVVEEIIELIVSEKTSALSQHPKISKKLAELMVLGLKKKLESHNKKTRGNKSPLREQILSALIKLGYTQKEIQGVVYSMPLNEINDFSSGLQHCLSRLSRVKFYHQDSNSPSPKESKTNGNLSYT